MSALHSFSIGATLCLALFICFGTVSTAPFEPEQGLEPYYTDASAGCYYNFEHYDEGDRIITNEPCLNCTCHNRMLMCYLRVCPFTKAIGEECTVEKKPDQCCPVITCPEVPVQLLSFTTTSTPEDSTDVGHADNYGCSIDEVFYSDGAQVPSNPHKPCELCYCIRNRTACLMQECTLHVDGCKPVYQDGVCCPVRYDCEYEEDNLVTTVKPTPGLIITTTMQPGNSLACYHNNEMYADGVLIDTDKPCEHCYCMKGEIVCAVQNCGTPLENAGKNCTALPPKEGQCCPDTYECDTETTTNLMTTESYIETTSLKHDYHSEITETQGQVTQGITPESETEVTEKQVTESSIITTDITLQDRDKPTEKSQISEQGEPEVEQSTKHVLEEEEVTKQTLEEHESTKDIHETVKSEMTTEHKPTEEIQEPSAAEVTTKGLQQTIEQEATTEHELIEKTKRPSEVQVTTEEIQLPIEPEITTAHIEVDQSSTRSEVTTEEIQLPIEPEITTAGIEEDQSSTESQVTTEQRPLEPEKTTEEVRQPSEAEITTDHKSIEVQKPTQEEQTTEEVQQPTESEITTEYKEIKKEQIPTESEKTTEEVERPIEKELTTESEEVQKPIEAEVTSEHISTEKVQESIEGEVTDKVQQSVETEITTEYKSSEEQKPITDEVTEGQQPVEAELTTEYKLSEVTRPTESEVTKEVQQPVEITTEFKSSDVQTATEGVETTEEIQQPVVIEVTTEHKATEELQKPVETEESTENIQSSSEAEITTEYKSTVDVHIPEKTSDQYGPTEEVTIKQESTEKEKTTENEEKSTEKEIQMITVTEILGDDLQKTTEPSVTEEHIISAHIPTDASKTVDKEVTEKEETSQPAEFEHTTHETEKSTEYAPTKEDKLPAEQESTAEYKAYENEITTVHELVEEIKTPEDILTETEQIPVQQTTEETQTPVKELGHETTEVQKTSEHEPTEESYTLKQEPVDVQKPTEEIKISEQVTTEKSTEYDLTEKPKLPEEEVKSSSEYAHETVTESDVISETEIYVTEHDKSYREEDTDMETEEHKDETSVPHMTQTPSLQENEVKEEDTHEDEDLAERFNFGNRTTQIPDEQITEKPVDVIIEQEHTTAPSEYTTIGKIDYEEHTKQASEEPGSHTEEIVTESMQLTEKPALPSEEVVTTESSKHESESTKFVPPSVDVTTVKEEIYKEKDTTESITTQISEKHDVSTSETAEHTTTLEESIHPVKDIHTTESIETEREKQQPATESIIPVTELKEEEENKILLNESTTELSIQVTEGSKSELTTHISPITVIPSEESVGTEQPIISNEVGTVTKQDDSHTDSYLTEAHTTEMDVIHMITDEEKTNEIETADHIMEPTTFKPYDIITETEPSIYHTQGDFTQTTELEVITEKHEPSQTSIKISEHTTEHVVEDSDHPSSESQKPTIVEHSTTEIITKEGSTESSSTLSTETVENEPTHVTVEPIRKTDTTESIITHSTQKTKKTEEPVQDIHTSTFIPEDTETEKQEIMNVEIITLSEEITETVTEEQKQEIDTDKSTIASTEKSVDIDSQTPETMVHIAHTEGSGLETEKPIPEEQPHETFEVIPTTSEHEIIESVTQQYETTQAAYDQITEKSVESTHVDVETPKPVIQETTILQEPETEITEKPKLETTGFDESTEVQSTTEHKIKHTETIESHITEPSITPSHITDSEEQITVTENILTQTQEEHDLEIETETTKSSTDHATESQSPVEVQTEVTTKSSIDHDQTTLPSIDESPLPVVPGEGSCLVEGQTYDNNSLVPSMNPCQSSCRCMSSIVQCESVSCQPPPVNMENCMPIYRTPHSCCPTYTCTGTKLTDLDSSSPETELTTVTEMVTIEPSQESEETHTTIEVATVKEQEPSQETVKVTTEEVEVTTFNLVKSSHDETIPDKTSDITEPAFEKEHTTVSLHDESKYTQEVTTISSTSPAQETEVPLTTALYESSQEVQTGTIAPESEITKAHKDLEEHTEEIIHTTVAATKETTHIKHEDKATTVALDLDHVTEAEIQEEKTTEYSLDEDTKHVTIPSVEYSTYKEIQETEKTLEQQTTEHISYVQEEVNTIPFEDHILETSTHGVVESTEQEKQHEGVPEKPSIETTTSAILEHITSEASKPLEEEKHVDVINESIEEMKHEVVESTQPSSESPVEEHEVSTKTELEKASHVQQTEKPEYELPEVTTTYEKDMITESPHEHEIVEEEKSTTSIISEVTEKVKQPEDTVMPSKKHEYGTTQSQEEITTGKVSTSEYEEPKQDTTENIMTTIRQEEESADHTSESSTEYEQSSEVTTTSVKHDTKETEEPQYTTTKVPEVSSSVVTTSPIDHTKATQEIEKPEDLQTETTAVSQSEEEMTLAPEQPTPEEYITPVIEIKHTTEAVTDIEQGTTSKQKTEEQTEKHLPTEMVTEESPVIENRSTEQTTTHTDVVQTTKHALEEEIVSTEHKLIDIDSTTEHISSTVKSEEHITTPAETVIEHEEPVQSTEKNIDETTVHLEEEISNVIQETEAPSHVTEETEKQTTILDVTKGHVTTDAIIHETEHEIPETSSEYSIETTISEEKSPEIETSSSEKAPEPETSSEHHISSDHTTEKIDNHTTQEIKEDLERQPTTEISEPHEHKEPAELITTARPFSPEDEGNEILSTDKEDEDVPTTTIEHLTTARLPEVTTNIPHVPEEVTTEKVIETTKHVELSTTESLIPTISSSVRPHISEEHVPEIPDYNAPSDDYEEDQNSFGPGTCRYGGKVYVSAQQIPRDDPCDFCFCFRSDIICLQQSCPPPIPGCHEEPILGFCCPRYECPVSMAVALNLTTTTTTTTTTLPPHFLTHVYEGATYRQGCQIQGKAYRVGEEVKSASGPCLQCTCGGDGQMKCDPKNCTPQPMLQQMIAAAASRRR